MIDSGYQIYEIHVIKIIVTFTSDLFGTDEY
jgi:hypothetical protein